jgi:predicted HTH transcriptional regulator
MKTNNYLENLIAQGEHQKLDFKHNISDSRKIARSIVAFANTDGGTLLIGVRDNGSIAGIQSDEEIFMLEAAANYYAKPEIELLTQVWHVEDKSVLEVNIMRSSVRPHFAQVENDKWLAYIRVNDNNILANRVLLKVWEREQGQKGIYLKYRKKEEQLLKKLQENETMSFSQVQKCVKLPKHVVENILANLICLDIIKININMDRFTYSLIKE